MITKKDEDDDDDDNDDYDDDWANWANGFNLHDWRLVDKKIFLGKKESKTVLREPLGPMTTTTGK